MNQNNFPSTPNNVQPESQPQADTLRVPEKMTQKEIAQEVRQRLASLKRMRDEHIRTELAKGAA